MYFEVGSEAYTQFSIMVARGVGGVEPDAEDVINNGNNGAISRSEVATCALVAPRGSGNQFFIRDALGLVNLTCPILVLQECMIKVATRRV